MRSVVIVHGAWHQPAHYEDVTARLRAGGAEVHVPDLAGLALVESTRHVQDLVDAAGQAPVVLAHSAGGIVAGGVTGAASTVYLAAWVLDVGEDPQQLIEQAASQGGADGGIAVVPQADGRLAVDAADARTSLFADCDEERAARAIALLRPEPASIFAHAPVRATWRDSDCTYVTAQDDRALPPALVPRFAARCTRSTTLATSHSPQVSRPDLVAELVAPLL